MSYPAVVGKVSGSEGGLANWVRRRLFANAETDSIDRSAPKWRVRTSSPPDLRRGAVIGELGSFWVSHDELLLNRC